jgi:hypothetical protein
MDFVHPKASAYAHAYVHLRMFICVCSFAYVHLRVCLRVCL